MNISKARKAIRILAIRERVTEREIRQEIEKTIAEALRQAKVREDCETLAQWAKIPFKGQHPTAYELVAYLAEEISKVDSPQIQE